MKNHHPTSNDGLHIQVAIYALTRAARGLPGLPSHPRDRKAVALQVIARETGIALNDLRRIHTHVDALRALPGMRAELPALRAAAVDTIAAVYRDRPLPAGCRGGIMLSEVSLATGISVATLKSPDCRNAIAACVATNGTAPPATPDSASDRAALEAYAEKLRSTGAPLPWNHRFGTPHYPTIARATGISIDRLRRTPLAEAMTLALAGIPAAGMVSVLEQAKLLSAHVDGAIARGDRLPEGPKGIRYKAIAGATGIAEHRLRLPALIEQIKRWRSALTDTPRVGRGTDHDGAAVGARP